MVDHRSDAWGRSAWGLIAAVSAALGGTLAMQHPLVPAAATLAFVLWGAVVAWRPGLWLFVMPAALPWLNFSPWTGWIAVDEFDLLCLGAVWGSSLRHAVWGAEGPRGADTPSATARVFEVAAAVFVVASTLACWRGLVSGDAVPFSLFQGYADPLNAWRVYKSLVWMALLWPSLRREVRADPAGSARRLGWGMVTGLAVVALAVLWERLAYTGMWDFSVRYRTTALFWEMHVGGAAIDAYLALSTPFLAWALWRTRIPVRWTVLAVLALLVGYACLTTFSRGVYGAVGGSLLLLWVLLRWQRGGRPTLRWRTLAAGVLMLALLVEVAAVLGLGSYMRERIVSSDRDLDSRRQHWHNGLRLMHGPQDVLWGIGTGRLPAAYAREVPRREFSGEVALVPATRWDDEPFVRVRGPNTRSDIDGLLALTQRVSWNPNGLHQVTFDVRAPIQTDVLLSLCELHLLYPRRCQSTWLRVRPTGEQWRHGTALLKGPALDPGDAWVPRLGVFSVAILDAGRQIDLRHLSLQGQDGRERLSNGDFSQGLARWFPSAQGYYIPWHIDNLGLEVLIERGAVALLAFAVCMAAALGAALRAVLRPAGERPDMVPFLAAALCGGLCVGLVSSLMDVPRVAWLLQLMAVCTLEFATVPQARSNAG